VIGYVKKHAVSTILSLFEWRSRKCLKKWS
jgi:hypothetical protein